jgi:hypothetical protein
MWRPPQGQNTRKSHTSHDANYRATVKDKGGKEETKKQTIGKNMLFDRDSFDRLMQLGQPTMA